MSGYSTRIFLLLSTLVFGVNFSSIQAQITGPEQDCFGAISVCDPYYEQLQSYIGSGTLNDINGNSGCLANDENNSVWYVFTVTTPGALEFELVPLGTDDYDFTLFNITGLSCADITNGTAIEERCNYAFTNAATGLQAGYTLTSAGPTQDAFLAPLNVNANETYVLMVDNFSSSQNGYELFFEEDPGNAIIRDVTKPTLSSVADLTCDNTTFLSLTFSEPIQCSSIDAADFQVTGPTSVTVIDASSADCDAGAESTQNVTLEFASPITSGGNYTVSLLANAIQDLCSLQNDPGSLAFAVPDIVEANFTFNQVTGCGVDNVTFTNTSIGNVTTLDWDFGDAATSVLNNPTHDYSTIGSYDVQLSVESADCMDDTIVTIDVLHEFDAAFSFSPDTPCIGEMVTFMDTSSTSATTWQWDFGDTEIAVDQNPTHAYTAAGIYTITLIIGEAGCVSDPVTHDIVVKELAAADPNLTGLDGCVDAPIQFTDNSTGAPNSWLWDFGDGETSTEQDPTHVYTTAGTFPITLTITDSFGCVGQASASGSTIILDRPSVTLRDTSVCYSEPATIDAPLGADAYLWSTGETTPSIVVTEVPVDVTVTVTQNGCSDTASTTVGEKTDDCSYAKVSTAFSPNGDGSNDYVTVFTLRVAEYELFIYNRWGEKVYYVQSTGDQMRDTWDGTHKDEPQGIGTYTYMLKWMPVRENEGQRLESGSITLVR